MDTTNVSNIISALSKFDNTAPEQKSLINVDMMDASDDVGQIVKSSPKPSSPKVVIDGPDVEKVQIKKVNFSDADVKIEQVIDKVSEKVTETAILDTMVSSLSSYKYGISYTTIYIFCAFLIVLAVYFIAKYLLHKRSHKNDSSEHDISYQEQQKLIENETKNETKKSSSSS